MENSFFQVKRRGEDWCKGEGREKCKEEGKK